MIGLTLREEFRGKRLKGTAIELSNDSKTGATMYMGWGEAMIAVPFNKQ